MRVAFDSHQHRPYPPPHSLARARTRSTSINEEELVGHWLHRIVLATGLLASPGANVGTLDAQGLTGQIAGTITDTEGGVMPRVTITLTNARAKATRDTVARGDGQFLFPDLLAGTYDLKASLVGFK